MIFFRNNIYKYLFEKVYVINNLDEYKKVSNTILSSNYTLNIMFLNYHAINLSLSNPNMYNSLLQSDYLFVDGIGVKKTLQAISHPYGVNMNGTDFIPFVLNENLLFKRPIVLIGSTVMKSNLAKDYLTSIGHNVILSLDGFTDDIQYFRSLSNIVHLNPIIILGMGMPKQESFSVKLVQEFPLNNLVIFSGGAIIDRFSGDVVRAPDVFLRFNLEWLYRFAKEPKRLFSRIFIGGFKYLFFTIIYILCFNLN